jgi:putative redox protein
MGRDVVVTSANLRFLQDVSIGPHQLKADELIASGGDDSGPNPYELLLAALGACTSMTLRMYADRKGWPLKKVRVRLTHEKIHAQDCAHCETKEGMLDLIKTEICCSASYLMSNVKGCWKSPTNAQFTGH